MTHTKKITLIIDDDERFKDYPETINISNNQNEFGKLEKTKRYLERGLRSYGKNRENIAEYSKLKSEITTLYQRLYHLDNTYCFEEDRYLQTFKKNLKSFEYTEEYKEKLALFQMLKIEYNAKCKKYESWHGKVSDFYHYRE